MGEKIMVGPDFKGLQTNVLPFAVDNTSFPFLLNAYQWRGRIKRKRGTSLLGRLQRFFNSTSTAYNSGSTTIKLNGAGNILTGFSLQANGNIVPGTVVLVASGGPTTYTDPTKDGYLTPTGTGGPNTINYATGVISIPAQAGNTVTATFNYYPDLPVMGLRDLNLNATQFPGTLAFDTVYSYNIQTVVPYGIYDVSFYKNPASGGVYTAKATVTPTSWNGQNYQQFWTVNYKGALWATNGINVPFSTANIGMQFAPSSTITYVSNTATTLTLTITNCPLIIGDFVFVNEWNGTNATSLNFQSGYVTAAAPNTPPFATKTITITFPNAVIGAGPYTAGIVQYLTNRSSLTIDCLRWYDGDPTNGSTTAPTFPTGLGWVNFAPPLSQAVYSIANRPQQQYYLVGARIILPFKDRLLFIGPVIQTSSPGTQVYLQDTVIYSQNGTPYYTASFDGSTPINAQTVFFPILVPTDQTATANAYWEDVTGFGGFISAGLAQPILTASPNEDVLILGFSSRQTRLVYSGNDVVPFNFYIVNSELGSGSTFSVITMDRGVMTTGEHGISMTSQVGSQRIDPDIPDQIFQFNLINNGPERVTAQRDFINEWVYFTYPSKQNTTYIFPTQTLQYNYRDNSWAIFNEAYTTYGQFRKTTGYTWATIGMTYLTWSSWNAPWNSGASSLMQPKVIAGNQQGFVLERDDGTNEGTSLYITSFSGTTVTSPNHCLNNFDYIVISGCLGTIGPLINGNIYQVFNTGVNTFMLNPSVPFSTTTYLGGGVITRMYVPLIQTRQFPPSWGIARKTRLGAQQYLLTSTDNGQIQLLIYLSENSLGITTNASNAGPIVPSINPDNNSLIYSTTLYTCPESTNLGLTAANVNLQTPTATAQEQIWHRVNTSLIGDTIQLGFTMSDAQMRDPTFSNQFVEIELHSLVIDVTPSQVLV